MTQRFKLGARPAVRPYGLADLASYTDAPMPDAPPGVADPSPDDTRMFDNDRLGCCTYAGVGHSVIAWNALVNESDHVPTDDELQTAYFDQTGGQDTGCVEADVLRKWYTEGLFGSKLAGYAPVERDNVNALHQSVAFYGVCYLGVALPMSAQDQFRASTRPVWTVVPGSPIEGGHCIVAVGYTPQYVIVRTWGGTVMVTYPWLAKYLTEAWAPLAHQFVEAGRGPRLNMDALTRDLPSV